jgi:transcription antitermination factor NusG
MAADLNSVKWYALQVRARWEQSTATVLSGKGYETLLPTFKARRRWTGRERDVVAPLFPGYVFCQFDASNRLPVLVTPGVISIVKRGQIPAPVETSEISALQILMSSGVRVEPWPYLEVGQRVLIESSALSGVEGILIGFKGERRVVVSVGLLRRSIALEIDKVLVRPVEDRGVNLIRPLAAPDALIG